MGLRDRKRRLLLILCAFGASFALALAAIIVIRHYKAPSGTAIILHGPGGYLAPAALDSQWVTYSDESTCPPGPG